MDDNNGPLIVLCEAMKEAEAQTRRYQVLIAVQQTDTLKLDQILNDACAEAGYLFMYSGKPILADQYLAQEMEYSSYVVLLCQELNNRTRASTTQTLKKEASKESALIEVDIISDDIEPPVINYLTINSFAIKPLPYEEYTPLENIPWIDLALKEALFAQPIAADTINCVSPSEMLRTYLIIDAARYNQCGLMWPLDLIDEVPVRCMYKGQAAIDLKDHAPYLIDVTLSAKAYADTSYVPRFVRSFFEDCWNEQIGIFVRTQASIEQVHRHFRKLTKIKDTENNKQLFFKFYDPQVLRYLLKFIRSQSSYIDHWFDVKNEQSSSLDALTYICAGDDPGNAKNVIISQTNERFKHAAKSPRMAFTLAVCRT